jgi:hypothetical protein
MTNNKIPTLDDKFHADQLRALAEDAMRSTDWRQSGEPTPDDLSEWLAMSAQRLAQVVADKADHSLAGCVGRGLPRTFDGSGPPNQIADEGGGMTTRREFCERFVREHHPGMAGASKGAPEKIEALATSWPRSASSC